MLDLDCKEDLVKIEESILICQSLRVQLSTSNLSTLHMLDRLLRFLQTNYHTLVPFITDSFDKLIPSSLVLPPVDTWIESIRALIASSLVYIRRVTLNANVPDVADLKQTCAVLSTIVGLFHAFASSALFSSFQPKAQMLFETQNVCVIITSEAILIPKASRAIRAIITQLKIDNAVEKQVTAAAELLEIQDEDSVSYQGTIDMVETLQSFQSFVIIKDRHDRASFLSALNDVISVETGVNSKKTKTATLGLATLKYVACSFPSPGLTPLGVIWKLNTSKEDAVEVELESGCMLPCNVATILQNVCNLVTILEQQHQGTSVDVAANAIPIDNLHAVLKDLEPRMKIESDNLDPKLHSITHSLNPFREAILKRSLHFQTSFNRQRTRLDRDRLRRLSTKPTGPAAIADEVTLAIQDGDHPEEVTLPTRKPTIAKRRRTVKEAPPPPPPEEKPLGPISLTGLLTNVPESMLNSFISVRDTLILCVGRFAHTSICGIPWITFLQTVGIAVDSVANENVSQCEVTPFLRCILDYCPLFVVSPFLATDLNAHLQMKSKDTVAEDQVYACLYNYLPKERCRSVQWLLDVLRCHEHLPGYLSDASADSWLMKLSDTDIMKTILHYAPCAIPYLMEEDDVVPSRRMFVLASPSLFTLCQHQSSTIQVTSSGTVEVAAVAKQSIPPAMVELSTLPFLYPCRESVCQFVRSPTRNVLLTGSTGRSLLEPLLQSTGDVFRVLVLLPKGIGGDQVWSFNGTRTNLDYSTSVLIEEAIYSDLNPLRSLAERFADRLIIDLVSFEWLEDSYLARKPVAPHDYLVNRLLTSSLSKRKHCEEEVTPTLDISSG